MTRPGLARRVVLAALAGATVLAATACAGNDGPADTDTPVVVASTDVWASVARAVGGEHADVTALFASPDGDPHEFEPSSSDTAKVQDANLLVLNGGHYDAFMETAAQDAKGRRVVATDVRTDPSRGNEHVFYDLVAVRQTADAIAAQLSEIAPVNATYYKEHAAAFDREIEGLRATLADIAQRKSGTDVVATEPLAVALLRDAGLKDVAPTGFSEAVEEGQSPSAADRAAFEDLLTSHRAKLMIYNTQAVDPVTEAMLATARRSDVPVVEFTETLPKGVTGYVAWQRGQIDALKKALGA